MNQKRYWLRGGFYGIIIPILFVVVFAITTLVSGEWEHCGDMGCVYSWLLFVLILGIPIFFLIGSAGGFIYGKFKNK